MLDALAAVRPSAQYELTGPAPGTGLIAVLGALSPDELDTLLARGGGGLAVLLDVPTWARAPEPGPDPRPGRPPLAAQAARPAPSRLAGRHRRRRGRPGHRLGRADPPGPGGGRVVTAVAAPTEAAAVAGPERPARPPLPWVTATVAGAAVLLAGTPVQVVVQGGGWLGYGAAAVAVVVATGLLLYRAPVPAVAAGQCAAVLLLMTALFTDDGVLGVLPGPRAVARLGELINGAGRQINVGFAPVATTPEILTLVTAAFGLLAVAVHLAAVSAGAPAAAGVPLLAAFAIPAALADELLPGGTVVAATAGYGLLLLTGTSARPPSRAALAAPAPGGCRADRGGRCCWPSASARAPGSSAPPAGSPAASAAVRGAIGLNPFTALRGQLTDAAPVELLRVRGLDRPTYIRALTLSEYVPDVGWRAPPPGARDAAPRPGAAAAADPGPDRRPADRERGPVRLLAAALRRAAGGGGAAGRAVGLRPAQRHRLHAAPPAGRELAGACAAAGTDRRRAAAGDRGDR